MGTQNMSKQLQIRNSTAEFLIFQAEDKAEGVQVFYKDSLYGRHKRQWQRFLTRDTYIAV